MNLFPSAQFRSQYITNISTEKERKKHSHFERLCPEINAKLNCAAKCSFQSKLYCNISLSRVNVFAKSSLPAKEPF